MLSFVISVGTDRDDGPYAEPSNLGREPRLPPRQQRESIQVYPPGFDAGPPILAPQSLSDLFSQAKTGDAHAQFQLALRYFEGDGVEVDTGKAVDLWRNAALQRHRASEVDLAYCLANGIGTAQDHSEALGWALKAADDGSEPGMYLVGDAFLTPWPGHNQDLDRGISSIRASAEHGYVYAQLRLAQLYLLGGLIETNAPEAVKWLTRAAAQGNVTAQGTLAICYRQGHGVAQDLGKAALWWRAAAEQGDVSAQYELGVCYEEGFGVEKDPAEAAKWFVKAGVGAGSDAQTKDTGAKLIQPTGKIVDSKGKVIEFSYKPRATDDPGYNVSAFERNQRDYVAREKAYQLGLQRLGQLRAAEERARQQAAERERIYTQQLELRARAISALQAHAQALNSNTQALKNNSAVAYGNSLSAQRNTTALQDNTTSLRAVAWELEFWRLQRGLR